MNRNMLRLGLTLCLVAEGALAQTVAGPPAPATNTLETTAPSAQSGGTTLLRKASCSGRLQLLGEKRHSRR